MISDKIKIIFTNKKIKITGAGLLGSLCRKNKFTCMILYPLLLLNEAKIKR